MIIKCPSCGFEQPLEGDYCPSCGGELQKLLAAEKQLKKIEHIKTRLMLVGLSSLLFLGYFLIFYTQSSEKQNSLTQIKSVKDATQPVRLNPSKIVGRITTPPKKPGDISHKKRAPKTVSASEITKSNTSSQVEAAKTKSADSLAKKSIRTIQLLDRFNCNEPEVKILLNEDETQALLNCSQVIVSNIAPKETFILEESKATVSMSLYLSESTLEVILTLLIDDEPVNHNYFYNLPQTKASTKSIVFPIQLKSPSPDIDKIIEDNPVLPLFFKRKTSNDPSNWSSLFFHATF